MSQCMKFNEKNILSKGQSHNTPSNMFIYVPQGCYAEINRATPDNVRGLLTAGMFPCCHVIVSNTSTRHSILCHADYTTNLEHQMSGVPRWIRKVCPDGDFTNLMVSVGENAGQPRFSATEETNYPIYDQVAKSLRDTILPHIYLKSTINPLL